MIFVLDNDRCLSVFPGTVQAEAHLEIVAIKYNRCRICDEKGQKYVGRIMSHGTTGPDEIKLSVVDSIDINLPHDFIKEAKDFSSFCPGIIHLSDLKKII